MEENEVIDPFELGNDIVGNDKRNIKLLQFMMQRALLDGDLELADTICDLMLKTEKSLDTLTDIALRPVKMELDVKKHNEDISTRKKEMVTKNIESAVKLASEVTKTVGVNSFANKYTVINDNLGKVPGVELISKTLT